jgi:hypothetical protein
MKSIKEWREEIINELKDDTNDTNWGYMKYVWGQNRQLIDPQILMKLRNRLEPLKKEYAIKNGVSNFDELPVEKINEFAKDIVGASLKSIYPDATGGGRVLAANNLGNLPMSSPAQDQNSLPQDQSAAPSNWKG